MTTSPSFSAKNARACLPLWRLSTESLEVYPTAASFVSGFSAAFLNTALFMSSLVLLFGNTEYVQGLMGGKNVFLFIIAFVGINAVFEMLVSTAVTGLLGKALERAKILGR